MTPQEAVKAFPRRFHDAKVDAERHCPVANRTVYVVWRQSMFVVTLRRHWGEVPVFECQSVGGCHPAAKPKSCAKSE